MLLYSKSTYIANRKVKFGNEVTQAIDFVCAIC